VCGGTGLASGRAGTFVMPVFGFIGKGERLESASPATRMALVESYFGEYQAGDNSDLRSVDPRARGDVPFSRQGGSRW